MNLDSIALGELSLSEQDLSVLLSDDLEGFQGLGPVRLTWNSGERDDVPLLLPILEADARQLLFDFHVARPNLKNNYLTERKSLLPLGLEKTKSILKDYGFDGVNYKAFAMKSLDDQFWLPSIPDFTVAWLGVTFPDSARVHYVDAAVGWTTKWHVDCLNFRRHGFRIHIPLSASAHYEFKLPSDKVVHMELKPGYAYLVNIAVPHRSFNLSDQNRISIILQLMSDELIPQESDVSSHL